MEALIHNISFWTKETAPDLLKTNYDNILKKSGFEVLQFSENHFNPQGYTALWLLSESHLAIHTFPENNKTYIELSSCVETQYRRFLNLIA